MCVFVRVCVPITVRMIGARCPDLEPPVNGVLKCQAFDTNLWVHTYTHLHAHACARAHTHTHTHTPLLHFIWQSVCGPCFTCNVTLCTAMWYMLCDCVWPCVIVTDLCIAMCYVRQTENGHITDCVWLSYKMCDTPCKATCYIVCDRLCMAMCYMLCDKLGMATCYMLCVTVHGHELMWQAVYGHMFMLNDTLPLGKSMCYILCDRLGRTTRYMLWDRLCMSLCYMLCQTVWTCITYCVMVYGHMLNAVWQCRDTCCILCDRLCTAICYTLWQCTDTLQAVWQAMYSHMLDVVGQTAWTCVTCFVSDCVWTRVMCCGSDWVHPCVTWCVTYCVWSHVTRCMTHCVYIHVLLCDRLYMSMCYMLCDRLCTATCYKGYEFQSGQHVVQRTCLTDSNSWLEGLDLLPDCIREYCLLTCCQPTALYALHLHCYS